MKSLRHYLHKKTGLIKKILLVMVLISAVLVLLWDLTWLYERFESGIGPQVAQAAITYHIVLLLGLVAAGIQFGFWVDRMIREKKHLFNSPVKGKWVEGLVNLWGYELNQEEQTSSAAKTEVDPDMTGSFVLLDLPTRRGRKPMFPVDRWVPIALKWENRDPMRDAFTLGDLIAHYLGTNPDGSPIITEQTYYSIWRSRALDEIRRLAASGKSLSVNETKKGNTKK